MISPLESRYKERILPVFDYFSNTVFYEKRVELELEYLNFFLEKINHTERVKYTEKDIENIAKKAVELEQTYKHDVRSIVESIKVWLTKNEQKSIKEYVHFGLTSHDVDNYALVISMESFFHSQLKPMIRKISNELENLEVNYKDLKIPGRTHGQVAVRTTFGKELSVFRARLEKILYGDRSLNSIPVKFGGAVGNNASLNEVYKLNWEELLDSFVWQGGNARLNPTTQITYYESWSQFFDTFRDINLILLDMAQDLWLYMSYDYITLDKGKNVVGSSTMPHKVNPVEFENAEGNIYMANALFNMFSNKLPISRLQRDLSDKTITRNIGVAVGYSWVAYTSILDGLKKIKVNKTEIERDLKKYEHKLNSELDQLKMRKDGQDGFWIIKEEY
jgi:adenylosuccinate lyase